MKTSKAYESSAKVRPSYISHILVKNKVFPKQVHASLIVSFIHTGPPDFIPQTVFAYL